MGKNTVVKEFYYSPKKEMQNIFEHLYIYVLMPIKLIF